MVLENYQGRLFERETEQFRLLETFERQIEYDAKRELILITGKSGTGKTALASTLQRVSKLRGGSFVKGKFDQFQRAEPYAPFKSAFNAFANSIVAQGPKRTSVVKESVAENIDSMDAAVLVNVVPALRPLLNTPEGETRTSSVFGADEAQRQKRITVAFCNFTRAISSPERPLVILIDDLQWADTCSLRLLYALVVEDDLDGLVLVGTCRNNEVEYGDELAILLRKLEDDMNMQVKEFYLKNLNEDRVKHMISDIFINMNPTSLQPLADFVFNLTKGNILFVLELLKSLKEQGCIYEKSKGKDSVWHYDETQMLSSKYAKSVQNLLVDRIRGLPKPVQDVLQVAACIGSDFDEKLLHDLIDTTHLSNSLDIAVRKTLILRGDHPNSYKFAHDSIQKAVYALIPLSERPRYHLIIGRDLHNALSEKKKLENNLYLVVNQLEQGIELVESQDEKYMIAELGLRAGEKAIESSDYHTAASYFDFGIGILCDDHWRHHYRLSLSLFESAAEVFYCLGKWEKMNVLIQSVLTNARTVHDKLRCHKTNVISLAATNRMDEAIMTGFGVLNDLGENLFQDFGKSHLVLESAKTKTLLKLYGHRLKNGRKRMNRNHIAIMEMLNVIYTFAAIRISTITPLIVLRMMQHTLLHGNCSLTPVALAAYGSIMTALGSHKIGYKFATLAVKRLEEFKPSVWEARVLLIYNIIWDWNQPIRLSIEPVRKVFNLGVTGGDIEAAMNGGYQCCTKLFHVAPLDHLACESKTCLDKMQLYCHNGLISYTKLLLQLSYNFMGLSSNPIVLTGDAMDEEVVLQKALEAQDLRLKMVVYTYSLVLTFTFNDYERAMIISKKALAVKDNVLCAFIFCLQIFYDGLTSIALAKQTTDPRKKREYCKNAKQSIRKMNTLAKKVPENILHKALLLRAEFDTFTGRYVQGLKKYQKSINLAKKEGFLHEHALACERAGIAFYHHNAAEAFHSTNTLAISGQKFLSDAYSSYKKWGAHAKVKQLQDNYPFLTTIPADSQASQLHLGV